MTIAYSKDAEKALKSLTKKQRDNILERINGLLETPPKGDIKPLQGLDMARLRVGKYRVIYEVVGDVVRIINVGARGDIYKQ